MKENFRLLILITLLLATWQTHGNAEIYKWVDEKGVTHYSQTPPSAHKANGSDSNNTAANAAATDAVSKRRVSKREFFEAVRNGNIETVQKALNAGIEEDIKEEGTTALILACDKGYLDIVKLLLQSKVDDVNAQDSSGDTALLRVILQAISRSNPFYDKKNSLPMIQLLLQNGADVNIMNAKGLDALMLCANKFNLAYADTECIPIALLLLEHGADIGAVNEKNMTALLFACYDETFELAKLLIEKGSDIHVRNKAEETSLILAAKRNAVKVAGLLLDKGVDVNAQDRSRLTALICAARNNNLELAKLLISNGADINLQRDLGFSALAEAMFAHLVEMVKLLVDNGADVNVTHSNGEKFIDLVEKQIAYYEKLQKNNTLSPKGVQGKYEFIAVRDYIKQPK